MDKKISPVSTATLYPNFKQNTVFERKEFGDQKLSIISFRIPVSTRTLSRLSGNYWQVF